MGQILIALKSASRFRKMHGLIYPLHSHFCTEEGRKSHFELRKGNPHSRRQTFYEPLNLSNKYFPHISFQGLITKTV